MKKIIKVLHKFSLLMELAIALLVIVAVLMNMVALVRDLSDVWSMKMDHAVLTTYLSSVLEAVIGIEFLKVLLHPNTDTILEVLLFVVTRHMIVQTTSVYEDLVVIVSVGILLAVKKYIKEDEDEEDTEKDMSEKNKKR